MSRDIDVVVPLSHFIEITGQIPVGEILVLGPGAGSPEAAERHRLWSHQLVNVREHFQIDSTYEERPAVRIPGVERNQLHRTVSI